jgi:hypothetical protein
MESGIFLFHSFSPFQKLLVVLGGFAILEASILAAIAMLLLLLLSRPENSEGIIVIRLRSLMLAHLSN